MPAAGGNKCIVYDVVFHPTALRMTGHHSSFKRMIETTALDGITQRFPQHVLNRTELKYPKIKFKGVAQKSMIRTSKETGERKTEANNSAMERMMKSFGDQVAATTESEKRTAKTAKQAEALKKAAGAAAAEAAENPDVVPKHSIVHRGQFDLQDYRGSRDSAPGAGRPTELVVSVHLPKCTSARTVDLDITEHSLTLDSREPGPYHLELALPYPVNPDDGSAQFDKSKRTLLVTLPVLPPEAPKPKPFTEPAPDRGDDDDEAAELGVTTGIEEIPANHLKSAESQQQPPPANLVGAAVAAAADVTDAMGEAVPKGDGAAEGEDEAAAAPAGAPPPAPRDEARWAALSTDLVDGMTFHQTDDVVSIQLPQLGGASTADLAFEEVAFGPLKTHRCVVTLLKTAPAGDTAVASMVLAFDIELDLGGSRCEGVGAAGDAGKGQCQAGEKIVVLLKKAAGVQLQRLRVGATIAELQELPFLTKQNIEAAKKGSELWKSTTHPSVVSLTRRANGNAGDVAIEIDVRADAKSTAARASPPPEKKPGVEEAMTKGLRDMFASKADAGEEATPPAAAAEADVASAARTAGAAASGGDDGGYGPLETARLKLYDDATSDQSQSGGVAAAAAAAAAAEPECRDDFIAAESFDGARPGYVFKDGDRGVGYYADAQPVVDASAAAAHEPLRLSNSLVDELE
mmetsp:Transcript_24331/g.72760  ORF Transcript_24331/g.72760 Transcript_24331/m.72760 type:complete len:689 (-) Transcript_24331:96-2162(-)